MTDAAPTSTEAAGSGLEAVGKWLVTSAGLSGLFITSGYIVQEAFQKFLGAAFPDLSANDYFVTAGEFLLDSITSAYTAIASHIWRIGIGAGLLLCAGAVWTRFVRGRLAIVPTTSMRSIVLMVAVLVLGLGKMVAFDVPAAYVEGLLTRRASVDLTAPQLSGFVATRASRLKLQIVCAHNQDLTADSTDTPSMQAIKTACKQGSGELTFQEQLTRLYLWNLGITLAALSLGIAWLHLHIRSTGLAALMSVLLLFNFVGLCQVYARSVRATTFESIVFWREKSDDAGTDRGILLWEGTKSLLLYDTAQGKVQQVSREKILRIQVEPEPLDVLAEHIKVTNQKQQQSSTTPAGEISSERSPSKRSGIRKR